MKMMTTIDPNTEPAVPSFAAAAAMSIIDDKISADLMAIIFSFLRPKEILRARLNKKMRQAATKTIVHGGIRVRSVKDYRAMAAMTTDLPNLQVIVLSLLEDGHKYNDGEDPNEQVAAETANYVVQDIEIISRFRKLLSLEIRVAPLNGRYPVLFDFPLLQKLYIRNCHYLKWDLEMLSGFPNLKELYCIDNERAVSGNINSLSVLKDTLERVKFSFCPSVEGNFMDLADFPRLKYLDMYGTAVTGDVRDIGVHDFAAIEEYCYLPETVYGGMGYAFQRVAEVPNFMNKIYRLTLMKQNQYLFKGYVWQLSRDSPDYYGWSRDAPPFMAEILVVGGRRGWRWHSRSGGENNSCEINWLDPEPKKDGSGYESYMSDLQRIQEKISIYSGYFEPPTEDEYRELLEARRE